MKEISLNASVMIIELDEFLDVNTNELANVFQEKNDSPVLVSLSIDHWLKHLNQKWTQAHISLIFGRFNSLKDFLKEIWDKSLCSNCQKYVFITDEDSLKLIIGERKIQDVFHLIIISMNEQRDEGIFNLYEVDPSQRGQFFKFGIWRRGLTKVSRVIFRNKFLDFKRKVIKCALMPLFPNVNILSENIPNHMKVDGIDYDIISNIGEKLNFQIKH
ncbi:uncharacterized protein [Lepeophtheirus salmonis]|uniref:uncharacterized protein n=1 Tax=Lepeophtheirus salmonis TaxID=72036 RepID=UPI003AF394A2